MKGNKFQTFYFLFSLFPSQVKYIFCSIFHQCPTGSSNRALLGTTPSWPSLQLLYSLEQFNSIHKKGPYRFFQRVRTSMLYQICGDLCKIIQWSLVCYIKELATSVSKLIADFCSIWQSTSLTYNRKTYLIKCACRSILIFINV